MPGGVIMQNPFTDPDWNGETKRVGRYALQLDSRRV